MDLLARLDVLPIWTGKSGSINRNWMAKMTLRECYIERSYYYPKLECEMNRIIGLNGSSSLGNEVIKAFCNGVHGDLQLGSTEDYRNILGVFQCFVAGAVWALKHYPAGNWIAPLANA